MSKPGKDTTGRLPFDTNKTEPVFTLRASDKLSAPALRHFAFLLGRNGLSEKSDQVYEKVAEFEQWLSKNIN